MEAVAVMPKLPETLDALVPGEILRIPATWNEYAELAYDTPYTIQFLNDEIILLDPVNVIHEQLVARLGKLFAICFDETDDCVVLGSNIKIMIPDRKGDFNADLSMVRGKSEYGPTPGGRESRVRIKNPEIVVEVLSNGTRGFDLGEKVKAYQTILSLQHVLFVDQQTVGASIYSRTSQPNQWLLTHYHALTDTVSIGDFTLPLADVYRKIDLSA